MPSPAASCFDAGEPVAEALPAAAARIGERPGRRAQTASKATAAVPNAAGAHRIPSSRSSRIAKPNRIELVAAIYRAAPAATRISASAPSQRTSGRIDAGIGIGDRHEHRARRRPREGGVAVVPVAPEPFGGLRADADARPLLAPCPRCAWLVPAIAGRASCRMSKSALRAEGHAGDGDGERRGRRATCGFRPTASERPTRYQRLRSKSRPCGSTSCSLVGAAASRDARARRAAARGCLPGRGRPRLLVGQPLGRRARREKCRRAPARCRRSASPCARISRAACGKRGEQLRLGRFEVAFAAAWRAGRASSASATRSAVVSDAVERDRRGEELGRRGGSRPPRRAPPRPECRAPISRSMSR